MVTDPKIDTRKEQPYVSIRTQVGVAELGPAIPQLLGEVAGWLGQQGLSPSGAPFLKYNLINMMDKLDLEMGWPTEKVLKGNERITTGTLPAGKYASVVYTGPFEGPGLMDANRVLIEWGRDNNIQWDGSTSDKGDTFAARYETYFTDPNVEPDSSKWETEVAIKVADKK
jgi:effector-binding domain-containing protein